MLANAKRAVLLLVAGLAGVAVAIAVGTAGAATQTATLGSTTGTPSQNICVASINCTYVPFSNVSVPELQVPFDGTVTSYSVNSGSAAGTVKLRVLRPAGGGQFTGAGTSPASPTLTAGVNTFAVSLSVKTGDVLGLDNASSALMFDTSNANPITAYYQPALADGSTAAPNQTARTGYRLLLSAVVQSTNTTTTTTTNGTTTTSATPLPRGLPPVISGARLIHKRFRVAAGRTPVSAKAPKGTSFRFTLSAPARVSVAITRRARGLRKGSKCVAPTAKLRRQHAKGCTRTIKVGTLTRASEPLGADSIAFSGRIGRRALKPGSYRATLGARNLGGQAKPVTLSFRVVK